MGGESQQSIGKLTPRLFIGVWPPVSVVEGLQVLPRSDADGVRWIPSENWHITLRFIGNADPADVITRLDGASFPGAIAVLGPTVIRFGRSVVVVPVAGLDELAAAVRDTTADVGRPPDRQAFDGHVTLARLRGHARCGVIGARIAAEFAVREVLLVKSETRSDGAVYETIGRWRTG